MRFERVLLIIPDYINTYYKNVDLSAGLGYISEALNQANIENKVFDMRLGYNADDLIKQIYNYQPDLLGFSMLTFGYLYNYSLIKKIKDKFRNLSVVLGGPHISTLREEVLRDCSEIDYGIILEGDQAIVELCEGKQPFSNIKGLLFRENGKILYTGDRAWIDDLDRINFPRFSKFEIDKYESGIPISTSRGCPHQCIFCPVQTAIGRKLRLRSAQSVVDEIEYWYSRGFYSFGITDDNFTFLSDRVHKICQEIKKRKLNGLSLSCGNGLRADRVDRKLLSEMKEAGFREVSFGVESANDHILKRIKKGESLAVIERAIRDSCSVGLMVTLFFLLGSPEETKEDLERSLDLALRYPVYDVRFYNIIPFPGTELFEWVKENNCLVRDIPEYLNSGSHWVNAPIFFTPQLSLKQRRELYFQLNSKVKIRTLKVKRAFHLGHVQRRLLEMGLPNWLSVLLAKFYYSRLFQLYIINTKLIYNLKQKIKKKFKS